MINTTHGWPFTPFIPGAVTGFPVSPIMVDDKDLFITSTVSSQPGPPGPPGLPGVSVVDANITVNGELIITLSDGKEIYAGDAVGPPGTNGTDGTNGVDGAPGPKGTKGSTGDQGPPGKDGEPGPKGPKGDSGKCDCDKEVKLISENYTVEQDDFYIGVKSDNPVTITFPTDWEESTEIIVKAEMSSPLGNRKITLVPVSPGKIDGKETYVITVGYDSVNLFYRDGNWFTI